MRDELMAWRGCWVGNSAALDTTIKVPAHIHPGADLRAYKVDSGLSPDVSHVSIMDFHGVMAHVFEMEGTFIGPHHNNLSVHGMSHHPGDLTPALGQQPLAFFQNRRLVVVFFYSPQGDLHCCLLKPTLVFYLFFFPLGSN